LGVNAEKELPGSLPAGECSYPSSLLSSVVLRWRRVRLDIERGAAGEEITGYAPRAGDGDVGGDYIHQSSILRRLTIRRMLPAGTRMAVEKNNPSPARMTETFASTPILHLQFSNDP
jgi:hypothetical protein